MIGPGFLALLLLHPCGVTAADIASDYALSIEQMIERDPGYADELTELLKRHETSIENAISAVVAEPIPATLAVGGLKAEELEALLHPPPRALTPDRRYERLSCWAAAAL